jgi:hypothetical protein
MIIEQDFLWTFSRQVASQPGMPPVFRLQSRDRRRGDEWRILHAFLISRWDLVKENPDPALWAKEFAKAGGPKRIGLTFLVYYSLSVSFVYIFFCGFLLPWIARMIGSPGNPVWREINPIGWCCALLPLVFACIVVTRCALCLYMQRDWLRR